MIPPLSQHDHLRLILRAFRDCKEPITYEAVSKQYHYETGEKLTFREYVKAKKAKVSK